MIKEKLGIRISLTITNILELSKEDYEAATEGNPPILAMNGIKEIEEKLYALQSKYMAAHKAFLIQKIPNKAFHYVKLLFKDNFLALLEIYGDSDECRCLSISDEDFTNTIQDIVDRWIREYDEGRAY